MPTGGHGGSHGYLMNEYVTSIIEDRKPLVNIAVALNMTVAGIVAHQSALKNGELMKIPQYSILRLLRIGEYSKGMSTMMLDSPFEGYRGMSTDFTKVYFQMNIRLYLTL